MSRHLVVVFAVLALAVTARAQVPLDASARAVRAHQALVALDRYLETWNSRMPRLWAASLHYPHVRPGPGAFEVSRTPEEYAAGVNFEQTLRTGWHHSEWVTREVLQVGLDKVHVAGMWQRYSTEDQPLASSVITYVVTEQNGRWGIQARFAAGAAPTDRAASDRNGTAALTAINAFLTAWNTHDPRTTAATLHYPQVRLGDSQVEVWDTPEAFLAGSEPGRQRTWHRLRLDQSKVVQASASGVNVTVTLSRLGRDGQALSKDEGLFLVVLRDGVWKVQARSMMGT